MANSSKVGDIAIIVGYYEQGGETKKRHRNIGTLMRTDHAEGPRFWLKINVEVLAPSLLALTRANGGMAKGDDAILLNVFEPREPGAKNTGRAPLEEDGLESDRPF